VAPQQLLVPYGRARPGDAGPEIRVLAGARLALSDGPYPFAEPPDLVRAVTVADRLELLRELTRELCGSWDRLAAIFADAYFEWVASLIAAATPELAARAGLFAPADWSFCALRPLPQAHLPAGEAPVRVDFAFWAGDRFIAIDLQGSGSVRSARRDELARLAANGTALVAVPGAALAQERAALLQRVLPAPMQRFWAGVDLPAGPFGPDALDLA
jgi:hypothetical protein